MSIFSSIANAEHTFAAWAEKELTSLVAAAPSIEKVAGPIIKYVGGALQIAAGIELGAPAAAIVGSVVDQAQSDLVTVSGLIYDFGANPTVGSIVTSVQTNLNGLLTAGHVSNPKSVDAITKSVASLGALATALAG